MKVITAVHALVDAGVDFTIIVAGVPSCTAVRTSPMTWMSAIHDSRRT